MTPVTDPNLIAQLEGGNSGKPVTDPNLIAQLEGNSGQPESLINRLANSGPISAINHIGGDIGAGEFQALKWMNNLWDGNNALTQHFKPSPFDLNNQQISAAAGVPNPTFIDRLAQGAISYAPAAVISPGATVESAAEALIPQALSKIPMIGNALARSSASQFLPGAIYGMGNAPNHPVLGAVLGGAFNTGVGGAASLIGKGIGTVVGSSNTLSALGNQILKYLNKSAGNAAALSPQEAAENLNTNYIDTQGNPLSADIGTVANNPLLKNVYNALRYSPFSGVSKNMNAVVRGQSDVALNDVQNQLQDVMQNDPANAINDQLKSAIKQQIPISNAVNQAPDYLNQLAEGVGDRSNLSKIQTQSVRSAYKNEKSIADQNFAPINNSDIRLEQLGVDNPFQGYGSKASDLLAQRQNMNNLFDNDNDLKSALNGELDKAQSVMQNFDKFGMTLPEAVQRIQTLGQLGRAAAKTNPNQARLINGLRDGLKGDVNNMLVQSGNQDLATQLQTANAHYENDVVPFWNNPEIRKAATNDKYIASDAKLSQGLHDPNNVTVLNKLPAQNQNAALYQLITKGKGDSEGMANMQPQDIGNRYQQLTSAVKQTVKSYNPDANQYFESLPNAIQKNNDLQNLTQALSKTFEKANASKQSTVDNLQSQLQDLKAQRFGAKSQTGIGADKLTTAIQSLLGAGVAGAGYASPLLGAAAIPLGFAARNVAKVLSNPDLIQAYIKGTQMPVKQAAMKGLSNYNLITPTVQQYLDSKR